MRIDNNFCYFLKYLCSPEKGCFSCVALKRAVFCKRCYCCLMPVIFAWNSGCWSFSAKYLSDLCLDLSGKTSFNFGCWFPDLSVSQTSIFFRILYYFCHSRQQGLVSIFIFFPSTLKTTREESKMSNLHTTLFQNNLYWCLDLIRHNIGKIGA